ncbi:non-specific lipid transfer protein GPI-anchored 7 isoform X1 [Daucus carota subsp. sativus]|uniref:non-specific lipid transfer protein GPI-anchored 7 isoform X1 n=1 Tax=Daucus carota subsp. sativus TaxID=79200 RepID=UPI0007EF7336|nr:PREDICTED: lipid transfer-like protein VAS isoform X1 [Daucus carota subsp. sativus]
MGSSGKIKTLILRVVFVIALTAIMSAEAQDVPTCASALVPCAVFLNATTKPPASCCDPLKDAVANQLECLCNLYNTPDLLNSLKINVTQALRLPTLCGVPDNLCQCGNRTSPNVPASGSPRYNDSSSKNHAGRLTSAGIFSGLLIWASLTLF